MSQRSSGVRSETGALGGAWPYLIHELIETYLTDEVLQSAYEQVTDARQKANEDENTFANRIKKPERDCCNVFRDRKLVKYFIRGLLPATRDAVNERVQTLKPTERGDLTVARRIATAEGSTYRARVMASTPAVPSKTRPRSSTLFTGVSEVSPNPTPFRLKPDMPRSRVRTSTGLTSGRETLKKRIRLRVSSNRSYSLAPTMERIKFR